MSVPATPTAALEPLDTALYAAAVEVTLTPTLTLALALALALTWMSCCEASGAPNCLRPSAYSRACATHASAAPRAPHEIPYLAEI